MDSRDKALIVAMEVAGVIPVSADDHTRLEKLLAQGLCTRVARPSSATSQWVYRLS